MRFLAGVCFFVLCIATAAFAHPPSAIDLSYDQDSHIFHFIIDHNSSNLRKHHIRKIIVYQNNREILTKHYVTQTRPTFLEGSVTVQAQGGDVLSLKAFCSKAGIKKASLTVSDEEVSGDDD